MHFAQSIFNSLLRTRLCTVHGKIVARVLDDALMMLTPQAPVCLFVLINPQHCHTLQASRIQPAENAGDTPFRTALQWWSDWPVRTLGPPIACIGLPGFTSHLACMPFVEFRQKLHAIVRPVGSLQDTSTPAPLLRSSVCGVVQPACYLLTLRSFRHGEYLLLQLVDEA